MQWSELYKQENQPTMDDINKFIDNNLWLELNSFLQQTYNVFPLITYSKCSAQKGWNVKYQKSGKSLCTLYPMEGYFIALIVIGEKEMTETELLMPLCCVYLQKLFEETPFSLGGRWLMINITDKNILNDSKNLIKIRVKPKK